MSIPYSLSAPSIDQRALTKRHCVNNNNNNNNNGRDMMSYCTTSVRTLDLFPVHPTGNLEEKLRGMSSTNNSAANSSGGSATSSSDTTNIFGDDKHQEFFDFLSTGQVSSTQSD